MFKTISRPLSAIVLLLSLLAVLLTAPVSAVVVDSQNPAVQGLASSADAHISQCLASKPAMPNKAGRAYVGGLGSFECDRLNSHHEFVSVRVEVRMLTLDLPGQVLDQFSTVRGSTPNTSPRREETEALHGSGYPTVAPCQGGHGVTKVYRIRTTVVSFGAHGTRSNSNDSDRRALTCYRR